MAYQRTNSASFFAATISSALLLPTNELAFPYQTKKPIGIPIFQ